MEPPTDRSLKSLAEKEFIVPRPTMQEHDGDPFPGNDDEVYRPVQLSSVNVYDPAADVFIPDYA